MALLLAMCMVAKPTTAPAPEQVAIEHGDDGQWMTGTTQLWTPASTQLPRSRRTGDTCPLSRLTEPPAEMSGFGPEPCPMPGHSLNQGPSLLFWASRHEFC